MRKRFRLVLMALVAMLTGVSLHAQTGTCTISTFPWSESFTDSTALACWTIVDGDGVATDNWQRSTTSGRTDSACVTAGRGSAADEWLITPAIVIPTGATNLKLEWYVSGVSYYNYFMPSYEVRLSTTDTALASFTDTLYNETYDGTWVRRTAMLDSFAGDTVYLAFHNTSAGAMSLSIDDIRIYYANAPVYTLTGEDRVVAPGSITLTANYVEGVTTGITYNWTSRMPSTAVTIAAAGDSAVLTYSAAGEDTVTLVVSNSYGSDTVEHYVTVVSCDPITQLPHTWDFEEPADCWTMVSNNGNDDEVWYRYQSNSYGHSGTGLLRASQSDSVASDSWAITPAVVIPANANGLVFSYYVRGLTSSRTSVSSHYQVLASTTGTEVANFTDTLYDETLGTGYVSRSVSISAYAGDTVYFAFRNITDAGGNTMFIDDVQVRYALEPVYSISAASTTQVGDVEILTAVYAEGDTTNISYAWHSMMADSSQAVLTPNGATATVQYTAGGVDTITLVVTNNYGSDTVQHVIEAYQCDAITEYPMQDGFEDGSHCWRIVSGNDYAGDNWRIYNASYYSHGGSRLLLGSYNDNGPVDDYAISPAYAIPTDATGLTLNYYLRGSTSDGVTSHYQVLVSTNGTAIAAFTDTLIDETYSSSSYVLRTMSLAAYAGDTIHIAFHNITAAGGSNMLIDDMEIRFANDPVFTIGGPSSAQVGQPAVFTARYVEGDTTNLTYVWTSNKVEDGSATVTAAGNTATFNYLTLGEDVITLIVTNNFGSDTVTQNVEVFNCETIEDFPYKEDFENDADCWTFISGNDWTVDDWRVNTTSTYAYSGTHILLGHYNDDADVDDYAVTPAFAIPENAEGFIFSYYLRGSSYAGIDNHYQVLITTDGSLTNFSDTLIDETYSGDYVRRIIPMDAYAGQTVHLAFHNMTEANGNNMMIDDVELRFANNPVYTIEGENSVMAPDTLTLTAHYVEGRTEGLTYSWHSEMAEAGLATMTTNDTVAILIYTVAGEDVVTFTATNNFGTNTAEHVVHVISCNPVMVYPYTEDFEDSLYCWQFVSGNDESSDDWRLSSRYGANSGSNCLVGWYNDYNPVDDWAIGPAIYLPEGATNINMSWYVRGTSYGSVSSTYQVLISTDGTELEAFDSVYGEVFTDSAVFMRRTISLDAYAGRTIHFAFRNVTPTDGYYMLIDDIEISLDSTNIGIAEVREGRNVTLYPNPTSSEVHISIAGMEGNVHMEVLDLSGRVVMQRDGMGTEHTLNVTSLPRGTYFVRLTGADLSEVRKLVVY